MRDVESNSVWLVARSGTEAAERLERTCVSKVLDRVGCVSQAITYTSRPVSLIVPTFGGLQTDAMRTILGRAIRDIAEAAEAEAVAVTYYDYDTATAWSYHGDRWFHAASTIKVAVLMGLFASVESGRLALNDRMYVRNRFFSTADGRIYRISASSDGNDAVHSAIGKLMRLRVLSEHMIATSSNLATNLLLDLVGTEFVNETLTRCGVRGVDLKRGVEDDAAFEAGINNRITSDGLVSLFRVIEDRSVFREESCEAMLDILRMQEFKRGIPAGLPDEIRTEAQFAHKTGEISTVSHDAGLVYLPGRAPYAIAILTQWPSPGAHRRETVAEISRVVFEHLTTSDLEEV